MPVDDYLTRVEARFRRIQGPDGWAYHVPGETAGGGEFLPTPSMTSAGLLAYALGRGVRKDKKAVPLLKDDGVQKGMKSLAKFMDQLSANKDQFFMPGMAGAKNYYLLWSIERMAVVYDIKKIGNRDWYRWGADLLLDKLRKDNSWNGQFGVADVCFAVLFLKRANVAEDLTRELNLLNPILKTPKK